MSIVPLLLSVIRTLAAFNALPPEAGAGTPPFDVTGTVTVVKPPRHFVLDDGTGRASIDVVHPPMPVRAGDVVRVTGYTEYHKNRRHALIGQAYDVVGHHPAPPPVRVRLDRLLADDYDLRLVTVQATVTEATVDDLQPNLTFLTLKADGENLLLALADQTNATGLVGAEVAVTGLYQRKRTSGWRLFLDPRLSLLSPDALRIVRPPPADPFDIPPLGNLVNVLPRDIDQMGYRRVAGRVIAVWQGDAALLKTGPEWGQTLRVKFTPDVTPPRIGDAVEVVGKPETDLFSLTLTSGRWRPCAAAPDTRLADAPPDAVRDISAREALSGPDGHFQVQARLNGETVRLRGHVVSILEPAGSRAHLLVESEGRQVLIDVSNVGVPPDVTPGALLSVTGVLLLDTDAWRPHAILPSIRGFFIVARTPGDLVVLAHPPWWTPGKLFMLLCALLATLAAILVYNRFLNYIAGRRGHEAQRERTSRAKADLKLQERTRLAVELHDTLSQNLEGVACQISATRDALACAPAAVEGCLDTAERMLGSCRTELRRCLFDLRGDALAAATFAEALRRTLNPLALDAAIDIDFATRTAPFDDAGVHATLCIVRELVANAVRHGQARHIRIAGSADGATLSVTVADDGRGFDPDRRPGPDEGHFGLQGIHDRLRRLDGTLALASRPGGPTEVRVTFPFRAHKGDDLP